MTKFRLHRVTESGVAYVTIVEAFDWMSLISMEQYIRPGAIVRIDVLGGELVDEGDTRRSDDVSK